MKLKEFFEKRSKQGKFSDNEAFTKYLATLTDSQEVPDEVEKLLEDNFLTRERATADKDVTKVIWAEAMDKVDLHIKKLLAPLDGLDKHQVNEIDVVEKDTFKKLKMLAEFLPKAIDKAKTANPDQTEEVTNLKKVNQEYLDKIKTINSEREVEKTELLKGFETEKGNILLDFSLKDRINKIEFASEHSELKPAITDVILSDLKKNNILSVDQSGNIRVQTDEGGVLKDKFNGNDPVTIEKLLEDRVKPYVKRNDVDPKNKQTPPRQKQQQATPEGKPTLRELQRNANPAPVKA